jgi:hypothetical protein
MLATLSPRPRITNAQIDAYCGASGRKFKDPTKLAERLKTL